MEAKLMFDIFDTNAEKQLEDGTLIDKLLGQDKKEPIKKSATIHKNSKTLVECVSCPCKLPEDQAREVDSIIKALPQDCQFNRKAYYADFQFEPDERAEVSILSDNTVDKTGEVVLVENMDLELYRKNKQVYYNHNYDESVGACVWIKCQNNKLRAKTAYPARPEGADWWKPETLWAMITAVPCLLPAKSVGFLNLTPAREATNEELEQHPDWNGAKIFDKTRLIEYSVCSMGVNNEAIIEAINVKSFSKDDMNKLGIEVKCPCNKPKEEPCTCHQHSINETVPEQGGNTVNPEYSSDDCVNNKIKELCGMEENKVYNQEQIKAIAYSHCHAKCIKKRRQVRIPTIDEMIIKALEKIDVETIAKKSLEAWKNRHRV